MRICFVLVVSLVTFCLPAVAEVPVVQSTVSTVPDRSWVEEHEFATDENLHARLSQTVVLDLEGAGSPGTGNGRYIDNTYRFIVDTEQEASFCIPPDDVYIKRLSIRQFRENSNTKRRKVKDPPKNTVLNHHRGGSCKPIVLEPGRYEVRVVHDSRHIAGGSRKAFLHSPTRSPTLGGIIQPGDNLGNPDFIAFRGPNGKFISDAAASTIGVALKSEATTVGLSEVFRITPFQSQFSGTKFRFQDGAGQNIRYQQKDPNPRCASNNRIFLNWPDPQEACIFDTVQMVIHDHGGSEFDMYLNAWVLGTQTVGGIDVDNSTNDVHFNSSNNHGQTMQLAYRGYDCTDAPCDATNLPLEEGEVALFAQCNYQGPAIVFKLDTPDLSLFDVAAAAGLGMGANLTRSVRVGPDTLAVLYPQANYAGDTLSVGEDAPCLTDIDVTDTTSLKILNRGAYIASSNGCVRCVLNGLNLRGYNLDGYNFTDSYLNNVQLNTSTLRGAILERTVMQGITANNATDFTGAQLLCTSFAGTNLTAANFGSNILQTDFSCRLDLTSATITAKQFPPDQWRFMNLTGSSMLELPPGLSSADNPLDLGGAILSYTTWLQNQTLDGANLGCYSAQEGSSSICADPGRPRQCTVLNGASLGRASLVKACLSGANLQSAVLSFSNLDGADLSQAKMLAEENGGPTSLRGAFMRNAVLDEADLSGALASNLNFYAGLGGTASARNIIAPDANFVGAYMVGADFTGSNTNLQRTTWSNAVLVNVKFEDADLSGDSNARAVTSFAGAHMQGVDFSTSQAAQTENADFSDSYWNLGESQSLNILLPTANLEFKGYWKAGTCLSDPNRLCSASSDCDTGDLCSFPMSSGSPAGVCETGGTECENDTGCASGDNCVAAPECVSALVSANGSTPQTDSNNLCPDTNRGPCDGRWENWLTPISQATPKSAVSPEFPVDPGAAQQCTVADFSWQFASP